MSKTDRKKKLAAKKRAAAEAIRRGEILVGTPRREPSGRRAKPKEGWNTPGPTKEVKARREALLPNGHGCTDDWIDVAESTGLLVPRHAEALRRYRGLIRQFARMAAVPGVSVLSDVRGAPLDAEQEEEQAREYRRVRNALEAAEIALKACHWRDVDVLDGCVRSPAMPTAAQMEKVRRCADTLVVWAGV